MPEGDAACRTEAPVERIGVLFGLLLAAVQAFWLRAGCTLCLAPAGISVGIALLARPEVMASVRHLRAAP